MQKPGRVGGVKLVLEKDKSGALWEKHKEVI